MSDLHPAAARGFDLEADAYDRGRPDYPEDAVAFLIDTLAIRPGAVVVDLAAGTGKLTRALEPSGADLIAVEPVPGMRQVLTVTMPEVRVLDGTAEALPIPDGSVDAIVVAQAFHWFDGTRAVAELARVLKPGGRLGIVFNVRDDADPLQLELERIWEPHRGDTPTHRTGAWQAAFEPADRFDPLTLRSFRNEQRVDADQLVDRVVSVSFIATLPSEHQARVADQVRELLDGNGEVILPYRTDVFWTERRPGD